MLETKNVAAITNFNPVKDSDKTGFSSRGMPDNQRPTASYLNYQSDKIPKTMNNKLLVFEFIKSSPEII